MSELRYDRGHVGDFVTFQMMPDKRNPDRQCATDIRRAMPVAGVSQVGVSTLQSRGQMGVEELRQLVIGREGVYAGVVCAVGKDGVGVLKPHTFEEGEEKKEDKKEDEEKKEKEEKKEEKKEEEEKKDEKEEKEEKKDDKEEIKEEIKDDKEEKKEDEKKDDDVHVDKKDDVDHVDKDDKKEVKGIVFHASAAAQGTVVAVGMTVLFEVMTKNGVVRLGGIIDYVSMVCI